MCEEKHSCRTCTGCWMTCEYYDDYCKSTKAECEHWKEPTKILVGENLFDLLRAKIRISFHMRESAFRPAKHTIAELHYFIDLINKIEEKYNKK